MPKYLEINLGEISTANCIHRIVLNSVVHKIGDKFLQILKALSRWLGVGINSYLSLLKLQDSSKFNSDFELY